jgi:polyisoprenoid-binding protein YceI
VASTPRVALNPDDLASGVSATVSVDLKSLDIGDATRNRHMRDRYLETGRFPRATLTFSRLVLDVSVHLVPGRPTRIRAISTFSIHGVDRPLTLDAMVTRLTEEQSGRTSFPTEPLHGVLGNGVRAIDLKYWRGGV